MARRGRKGRETADKADASAKSHNERGEDSSALKKVAKKPQGGFLKKSRAYFLAGILVTAPISITFYLAWLVINFFDTRITPLLPAKYSPETYLPFGVPGVGLFIFILFLTLVGWLTAGLLGRWVMRIAERVLHRMPVIRSIYSATKQIVETILADQSETFRQVVLFEYPRRGSWAIGFITGMTQGEVQSLTTDDVVNVFLPTTPNPTSGYLLFLPRRELVVLSMTVEEGIKMVVSGGIVTPPDRRPDKDKQIKKVAAADRETQTIPMEKADPMEKAGD
ncbi:MAG: DUF502 domain-containing protein [Rhodospirillaceae bacterium]|jgi:uncharacterized membrane protein|nr:DUF502 domain-containing protein [Rhodospirillaceae bacterium]MBT6118430.1 DUF502 domain-containing protein [Rhodospirillaceae bacterium]